MRNSPLLRNLRSRLVVEHDRRLQLHQREVVLRRGGRVHESKPRHIHRLEVHAACKVHDVSHHPSGCRAAMTLRLPLRHGLMNASTTSRIVSGVKFRALLCGAALFVGCGTSASDLSVLPADAAAGDAPTGDSPQAADGGATQDGSSAADATISTYPNCDGPTSYPCSATRSCLADCQTCPGTANDCLVSSYPDSVITRSCVAACDTSCTLQTSEDAGISLKDLCGNKCTSVARDVENCGTCGHRCPSGDTFCSKGHCCGNDGHGQPLTWNTGCQMCCSTDGFIGQCAASGCKPAD